MVLGTIIGIIVILVIAAAVLYWPIRLLAGLYLELFGVGS
jgi:hypothetical protein